MNEAIDARGVVVELGGAPIVRGVDLAVGEGEVLALLGANGSGKSTLVRSLVGVVPLAAGSVRLLGAPLGAVLLVSGDPHALRWVVALSILALLLLLMSGWRFRGTPSPGLTTGVGALGGVLGGIAMSPGPPVIAYLLGREGDARKARATFALFLAANWIVAAAAFAVAGLLVASLLVPLAVILPIYGIGIWCGTRMFGLASELAFRRACYAMIAAAAVISLPIWDRMAQ